MVLQYRGKLARARGITAANAATETEVLKAGELGQVTDTGDLRVGDGTTAFNNLKSVRNHRRVRTVTATTTLDVNDEVVIVNSAGAATITLPSAVTQSGRVVTVKNRTAAQTVTVNAAAGTVETAGQSLTAGQVGRYVSDGTNWYIL